MKENIFWRTLLILIMMSFTLQSYAHNCHANIYNTSDKDYIVEFQQTPYNHDHVDFFHINPSQCLNDNTRDGPCIVKADTKTDIHYTGSWAVGYAIIMDIDGNEITKGFFAGFSNDKLCPSFDLQPYKNIQWDTPHLGDITISNDF